MVSTSVCGDGAKGRRGACRGGQVLELLAWRCEPESAAPRLRGPPAPLRGVNVSDRGCSLRARCHARSSRAQSKKKRFTIYRLWRGLLQLNVAQSIKTLTSFWGHDGGWDPDRTRTIVIWSSGSLAPLRRATPVDLRAEGPRRRLRRRVPVNPGQRAGDSARETAAGRAVGRATSDRPPRLPPEAWSRSRLKRRRDPARRPRPRPRRFASRPGLRRCL